jgi:hypothetical protein
VRETTEIAERVREVLRSRGLSFAKASRASAHLFPHLPRCRVPRNFYHDLRTTRLSPDLFQVFALSTVSGYRLTDWLKLFGLPIERIPHLQLLLPAKRTMLLDSALYGREDAALSTVDVRWPTDAICPLGRLLGDIEIRPAPSTPEAEAETYAYARVGTEDAFAFPDLVPGSIVRIDKREPRRFLPLRNGELSSALFLVEHAGGVFCCRLRRADTRRVTLHTSELAYSQVSLDLDQEVRIHGVVDLEVRRLAQPQSPEVPPALAGFWKPGSFVRFEEAGGLGSWIRRSRVRSGLHFREASSQTATIADLLQDSRYFIASGSLSDYETTDRPPRQIQKILALCIIYSLGVDKFLQKTGLPLEQAGRDHLPDDWLPGQPRTTPLTGAIVGAAKLPGSVSLPSLVAQLPGLPHFLAGSLRELTGLAAPSVRDVFWMRRNRVSFHPYLRGALFIVVDRRIKRPRPIAGAAISNQPIYVLLRRDGRYLCGRCSLEGDDLVVHPFSNGLAEPVRYRNRIDAEVIGQIVTVVRRTLANA